MELWRWGLFQGMALTALAQMVASLVQTPVKCPHTEQVSHAFLVCIQNVTLSGQSLGRDTADIERRCQDGDYSIAVRCVEGLFAACSGWDEQIKILHTWAIPAIIRLSFSNLCDNINVYTVHSVCMQRLQKEIRECQTREKHILNQTLTQHLYRRDESRMMDVWKSYCRHQRLINNCSIKPIARLCGQDIGEVISLAMTGVMPSICHEFEHKHSQQQLQQIGQSCPPLSAHATMVSFFFMGGYLVPLLLLR